MLERTVTTQVITVANSTEALVTGVAIAGTAKVLLFEWENGDVTPPIDGLALGMRITPCYPFPSGGTYMGYFIRSTTLHFLVFDPVFDNARIATKYRVSLYEPSSLTPVDIEFTAGFSSSATARAKLTGNVVLLDAGFTTAATARAKMTGGVTLLDAGFSTSATARAGMTASRNVELQAAFSSAAAASASLTGFTVGFGVSYAIEARATAKLTGSAVFFSAGFGTYTTATASLSDVESANGVSFCAVVNEVLNLWGIEGVCNAPDFAVDRAVADVNGAMQTIWNQAADRNYWTSSTLTLTFTSAASSQDLPPNIQNVVGPCRRADNRRPLATIGSIGELETFSDIYLDGETADEPLAYHVERMNQSGDDPVKTVLHVTPPVTGDPVALLLDVVREAPRFYVGDLNECPILPIPHRYTESLLMPIVRYKASSFWLFNNTESKATIDRDYQMAMNAIGLADPNPGKAVEKEGSPAK